MEFSEYTQLKIKDNIQKMEQRFQEIYQDRLKCTDILHEICGNFVFYLGWGDVDNKYRCFQAAYIMLTTTLDGTILYENGNIIDKRAYSIETVKTNTKNYFAHYSKKLNEI